MHLPIALITHQMAPESRPPASELTAPASIALTSVVLPFDIAAIPGHHLPAEPVHAARPLRPQRLILRRRALADGGEHRRERLPPHLCPHRHPRLMSLPAPSPTSTRRQKDSAALASRVTDASYRPAQRRPRPRSRPAPAGAGATSRWESEANVPFKPGTPQSPVRWSCRVGAGR